MMSQIITVTGWLAGWAATGRPKRLEARPQWDAWGGSPEGRQVPSISLIVPARNEALRLPELLGALEADRVLGGTWELIVVDDASSDDTGRLAAATATRVISTSPPPGWNGKAWACWTGALAARGIILVFLDADTRPAPGFVTQMAADAHQLGGLVSVQPRHHVRQLYEQLSAVANVVASMAGTGAPAGKRRAWWRGPVVFGPAMAVPASAYMRAGGHERAKTAVAEDLALARTMHMAGTTVVAYHSGRGPCFIEYRMYPHGLSSLIEGWTKNLAAGACAVPPVRAALVAVWVTGATAAFAGVARAPLFYALYAIQMSVLMRRSGTFHPATAALYPVPLAVFLLMFGRSALCRLANRRVRWRGRAVEA
jgi:4,4'-diaponeurosporenoate glycosyltransferase